jgi:hypothetical protein
MANLRSAVSEFWADRSVRNAVVGGLVATAAAAAATLTFWLMW